MKNPHNVDGMYFRIERDGKWKNICFSDLEENEMYEILKNKDKEWIIQLTIMLGTQIYNIVEQFEIYRGNK